jgi:hypothetical protein
VRGGVEVLEAPFDVQGSYARTQFEDKVANLRRVSEPLTRITGRGGNPWSRALIDALADLSKTGQGIGIVRRKIKDIREILQGDLETSPGFRQYIEQMDPQAQADRERELRLQILGDEAGARELTRELEAPETPETPEER